VVPSPREVDDAHWLVYRAYLDRGSPAAEGGCAAVAWVRGGGLGPVTSRDEQPVTRPIAKAEMWAASAAERIVSTPPPLESICAELGVAYWRPGEVDRSWATGVRAVLRWLLGTPGQKAPAEVPPRNTSGELLTAQQLYEAAMAAAPHQNWGPEERHALRHRMEVNAIRYQRLAALIEDTKRRLSAAS
jgi:hypothetical protein